MALGFNATLRTARGQKIADAVNGGAGAGKLRIYAGTRPATGGTATTLLAELTFADPMEASVSSGVLTADSIIGDTSADATGTAAWFRVVDSTGTHVMDGDVGTSGSDLNLTSTSIVATEGVDVTSFVLTEGNA
ncbi:MAG: hypothetical protein HY749_16225 [Gammaproteobacteria bacterium]|nr:hypothetical protein [Gammaproteobacteria bacterium]